MKEPSEKRKQILALQARAIRFSNNINQSYPIGSVTYPSRIVWDQLVRAGDSASNNLFEADGASSDADFVNKMRIAFKELKESKACLAKIRLGPLNQPDSSIAVVEELRSSCVFDVTFPKAVSLAAVAKRSGESTHFVIRRKESALYLVEIR